MKTPRSLKWGITLLALLALPLAACSAGPGGLLRPNGVAVAPDGTLYVMDRGNYRVVHLSPSGEFLDAFGQLGRSPSDIYTGWDVGVDASGNIYICNMVSTEDGSSVEHDGVRVFAPDGHLLREIGGQDYVYDDTSIPHNYPYGLDLDSQGWVYIADLAPNTVRVYDAQGQMLARFFGASGSGEGEFNDMMDVAVDDRRGLLYVVDSLNCRIQQYSLSFSTSGIPTATYRLAFGEYGREPGQLSYPQSAAVDRESGRVYVSDMGNLRIQVFDPEGTYLAQLVPPSMETWQVMGLAVGSDGAVYAADAFNNAIWVFESDGSLRRQIEVQP